MRPDATDAVTPRMLPKEHGAYGQLGMPLLVSLCAGRPNAAGALFAAGAFAAFVAHEPLLVLLGHRGGRVLREQQAAARRHLAARAGAALAFGAVGLWAADPTTRMGALAALAGPLAMVPVVWRKAERSAVGELMASVTLSGAALPSMLSAGVGVARALTVWAVWALCFALSTFAVRGVIHRAKAAGDRREALVGMAAAVVALGGAVAIGAAGVAPWGVSLAVAPFAAMALALGAAPPSPRHLKRVGWALVGASVATAAMLVAGLRCA